MAFKMKGWSNTPYVKNKTPYRDHGPEHNVDLGPVYAPGAEPIYGTHEYIDESGNRVSNQYLQEEEGAIKPRNWDRQNYWQQYVDRRTQYNPTTSQDVQAPGIERYTKNLSIEDPNNPGSYIRTPGKSGWVFDPRGKYDRGYGGHIQHRKVDLADKGYRNINVRMGHAYHPDGMRLSDGRINKYGRRFRYETMTSGDSDLFTRRVNTGKEGRKGSRGAENVYMDEWGGSRPVRYNTVTGRYEPVSNIHEYGNFSQSELNRLRDDATTRKRFGRTVTGGDVRHYIDDGRERYITADEGNKLKTTRVVDGKRRVKKTLFDPETEVTTEKSARGWLNLRDRKRIEDGQEVPAWFGRDAVKKIRDKRDKKKSNVTKNKSSNIKTDMEDIVLTPKMQKKRDRKHVLSQMFKRKKKRNKKK